MNVLKLAQLAAFGAALAVPAVSAHAEDPIKIGAVLSMTGPAGYAGDPEEKTLRSEVKALNEAGGLLGRPVELVIYDDGGDANTARTYITRLTENDGVVAVIGGSLTGTTMAMIPVAEMAELPQISWRVLFKSLSLSVLMFSRPRIPTAWLVKKSSPT